MFIAFSLDMHNTEKEGLKGDFFFSVSIIS